MYNELIEALRYCADEGKVCTEQTNCGYYGKGFFCQDVLMCDAADAIERLIAEVDRKDKAIQGLLTQIERKDKTIERMRDLMKHYKAAYKTAYKLYQEARHDKLS